MVVNDNAQIMDKRGVLEYIVGSPPGASSLLQESPFMRKELNIIEIEESSGNVYEDLGTPHANEMRVKSQLAAKIGEIIKARHLTQVQASEILGLSQPKLSEMLRGKFRGISEAKMMECLLLLGRDVQIVVKPAPRSRKVGRLEVVFA
jgi:predicted XRE-type DNA-binding protein